MKYSTAPKKSGRGGYRPGAGRKSEDGRESFANISARIDEESYNLILTMGNGNVSLGVRNVCHAFIESPAKMKSISKPVEPVAPTLFYRGKPVA